MKDRMKYGSVQRKIEKDHGGKMRDIIINSYMFGTPGGSVEITDFNDGSARDNYPVWKKLEEELFKEGEISHIARPVAV